MYYMGNVFIYKNVSFSNTMLRYLVTALYHHDNNLGVCLYFEFVFSYFGCQQLLLDFQHLLQWFENDSFSLTLDELNEIQSLDVIRQMRSAIIILSCQSDGRKKSRGRDNSFGSDLSGSGFIGSTQSAVSQVSQVSIGKRIISSQHCMRGLTHFKPLVSFCTPEVF